MDDEFVIDLKQARHPVIERSLPTGEPFIPNDIYLDDTDQQIMMITGPNMSGKSAILRQTALIVLMAQMGCFVPASAARIGRIDKVFSRVGASDNISSGESTFMVEMNETSSILNNVSPRSLILLDEIGRGTSTYDGISIAWAIAEFLHESAPGAPKTLFATHYHELNQLADKYHRVKNFNVATKESHNQIVFLRKLQAGGSHHSFGIQVARMAGMPDLVIERARQILSRLESKNIQQKEETEQKLAQMKPTTGVQLSMFGSADPQWEAFREELQELDLSTMTPIECMMKLKSIQEQINENNKTPSKNR
jgi:DNA mismatch repair protein MutS